MGPVTWLTPRGGTSKVRSPNPGRRVVDSGLVPTGKSPYLKSGLDPSGVPSSEPGGSTLVYEVHIRVPPPDHPSALPLTKDVAGVGGL